MHAEAPELPVVASVEPQEPQLTDAERAEAASAVPQMIAEQRELPRYRVIAGGRAWYRGQQIRFTTGEEFTAETWDEIAITGFRECGVTIEPIQ